MQLIKSRTLWLILYLVAEQSITSCYHWYIAKEAGPVQQNLEMKKDSFSLGKRIWREVVRSQVYGFEALSHLPMRR